MRTMLSRTGQLTQKLDYSGINQFERVTDEELMELYTSVCEQARVCADFEDKIAYFYWFAKSIEYENYLRNRNFKFVAEGGLTYNNG